MNNIDVLFNSQLKMARDNDDILESVIRDLSNLLNSKPLYNKADVDLDSFIFFYGLQNLSYYSPYSKNDQQKVSSLIASSIANFEPRLRDVTVSRNDMGDDYNIIFHFKITARLQLVNESFPITLESKIDTDLKKIILMRR